MFPITVSFTANDAAELARIQSIFAPASTSKTAINDPVKAADKVIKEVQAVSEKAMQKPEPVEAPADNAKEYSVDDAKALTMKIVADKGRDTAVELLKKYGVPVAAKLAADQVQAFCADAEAVLAS